MNEFNRKIILLILSLGVALLLFISLFSTQVQDLSFFSSSPSRPYTGVAGAYLSLALFLLWGKAAYLFPFFLILWAVTNFRRSGPLLVITSQFWGVLLVLISSSAFLSLLAFSQAEYLRWEAGGGVGYFLSLYLVKYFGTVAAFGLAIILLLISALLATEFALLPMSARLGKALARLFKKIKKPAFKKKVPLLEIPRVVAPPLPPEKKVTPLILPRREPQPREEVAREEKARSRPPALPGHYQLPSLDLLDSPPPVAEREIEEDPEKNSRILEETLRDFGIEVKAVGVEKGPVITRYELEPAPGVKIQRITSLSSDIALAMKAESVRIVAPIPGKGRVGVEVPNRVSTLVYLIETLSSSEFKNSPSLLTLALGKDISGIPTVADLGDMPHLLIAGTTGSGKTVCVNSLITTLLFRATPEEVRFLMIDPKRVELAAFNGIPHLLCPVVTEPKRVSQALSWIVGEMEERYRLLAKVGVRNIEIFNEKVEKGFKREFLPEEGEEEINLSEKLPYLVIVIDELADLMAVASREIENAITRLAQLSRAVGIHMVLATQRPSVDVITGVIKANFPARISFQVASKVDSRTVLDMNGADKLLGKGDMLFLEPGRPRPVRAQGTLIQDHEIERIVDFIKKQRPPQYREDIFKVKETEHKTFEEDELYEEAVRVVVETGQASVSLLQRRLGLGYQRAARLIDTMQDKGIVGPPRGSRPREILVKGSALGSARGVLRTNPGIRQKP